MKTMKRILLAGLSLALLMSGIVFKNGTAEATSGAPCTVFADPDFNNGQDFGLGNHDYSELMVSGGVGNDRISCIRVTPGYKVTLYANSGFSGNAKSFTASNPWITFFDDCTSSLTVETVSLPVILYPDANYGGTAVALDKGNYDVSELSAYGIGNDTITSVQVAEGYKVTLYQNQGYNGSVKAMTQSNSNITDFDNTASSLRVETAAPCTLYADPDFCIAQDFSLGNHDISELNWPDGIGNDRVSSIRVSPGYKVTLYTNGGYSGNSKVMTKSSMWMSDFDDCVSSLLVEPASSHAPVTVYTDANYNGTAQEFGLGNHDVGELTASGGVGNDKISSLRVAPGYKVTLYTNYNFSGSSRVVTSDYSYIDYYAGGFNDEVSSLKVETVTGVDSTCIQVSSYTDAQKVSLIQTFAPKIWMASGETAGASAVEYVSPYLQRYLCMAGGADIAKYRYRTVQTMNSPSDILPFFAGDQANAKVYAFWTEKDYNNIDLTYWTFFPYDTGKSVIGSTFGCHVGDWEHVTVRLAKFSENGVNYVKPVAVALPAHSFTNYYNWDDISKENSTHIIAYCASGTHGMWRDSGAHMYNDIVVAQLTDYCDAGSAWNTWNTLETYQYNPGSLSGVGLGSSLWPACFDTDYQNPNSGAVIRWGNEPNGSLFGQPLLANGANGPESHDALYDWVIFK